MLKKGIILSWLAACSGCATVESGIGRPEVTLRDVAVSEIDLDRQSFVLNFDVSNPNPFPLPISEVAYGVELDGHRFASGAAKCAIVVPAASDSSFEITVDLNLLDTAPRLLFVMRDGVSRKIPYALSGTFEVDVPLAPSVSFTNRGNVQLASAW